MNQKIKADLYSAIKKAKAMADCGDPEEALSALEMALNLKPDKRTKIMICQGRAKIKRSELFDAALLLGGLLKDIEPNNCTVAYAMPKTAAIFPALYYRLRGTLVRLQPSGSVKVTINPGNVQNVIFIRQGQPVGLAVCSAVQPAPEKCWFVHYSGLRMVQELEI